MLSCRAIETLTWETAAHRCVSASCWRLLRHGHDHASNYCVCVDILCGALGRGEGNLRTVWYIWYANGNIFSFNDSSMALWEEDENCHQEAGRGMINKYALFSASVALHVLGCFYKCDCSHAITQYMSPLHCSAYGSVAKTSYSTL